MAQNVNYGSSYQDGDLSDSDAISDNFKPYHSSFYDSIRNNSSSLPLPLPPHPCKHQTFKVVPDYEGFYCNQDEKVNVCTVVPYTNCCPSCHDTRFNGDRKASKMSLSHYHICCKNMLEKERRNSLGKAPNVKRYPITVGTPKYYRKPTSSCSIFKKPSTLCLPLASQQDPVICKKPKKLIDEDVTLENLSARGDVDFPPHTMDSQGDATAKMPDLNDMLKMLENEPNLPKKIKSKSDILKFAKFLKPKMPPSIKAQQKATKFSEKKVEGRIEDTVEDSLEKLLKQLKKTEVVVENDKLEKVNFCCDEKKNETKQENNDNDVKKQEGNRLSKSFNYQDINDKLLKQKPSVESLTSIQHITNKLANSAPSSTSSGKPRSHPPPQPHPLDDHSALELHRSKSYIVSLIDKALSKELGTVPCERTRKKFDEIDAIRRRRSSANNCRSDKDLSVEITTALAESIISTATAPTNDNVPSTSQSESKSKVCCCTVEEPSYIKQLKQLRWGHLKHIQREVKRLEDLERFLDSCSMTTIPEM